MKRSVQIALIFVLGIALVYAIFSNQTNDKASAEDVALQNVAGEVQTIKKGNVILNFWATYCPPCEREMPALNAAYHDLSDSVQLYAVNVEEPTRIVNQYIKNKAVDFPVLLDRTGELKDAYQITMLPTTLFIKNGDVVHTVKGEITEAEIKALTIQYLD